LKKEKEKEAGIEEKKVDQLPGWTKTGKLAIVNIFFFALVCFGIVLASGTFNLLGFFKGSVKKDDGL
jgi:hypothetical protein